MKSKGSVEGDGLACEGEGEVGGIGLAGRVQVGVFEDAPVAVLAHQDLVIFVDVAQLLAVELTLVTRLHRRGMSR